MHGIRIRSTVVALLALASMVAVAAGTASAQDPSPVGSQASSAAPSDTTTTEFLRETFDAPGPWWVGSDDVGTSSVADGVMRWTISKDGRSIWDTRELAVPQDRVRVEATVMVEDGVGAVGPVCAGRDTANRAIWAGVNGAEWLVGRLIDSRIEVVERGNLASVLDEDMWIGAVPLRVRLECAVDDGADRSTVRIEGVEVADVVGEPIGPFEEAGLIAIADQAGLTVLFDDVTITGGPDAPDAPPSPSGAPAS
jgi:hypothetical protein